MTRDRNLLSRGFPTETIVGGGYADASFPVTVEGDKNAAYDIILKSKQFYTLTQ